MVININLHSCLSKAETRHEHPDRMCNIYANIKEEASGVQMTVCSGETRFKHVYTTVSNSVEIQIVHTGDDGDDSAYFAIAFQGIICQILTHV